MAFLLGVAVIVIHYIYAFYFMKANENHKSVDTSDNTSPTDFDF